MSVIQRESMKPRRSQQGVALVVALILLIVITLLGLGAVRSTTVQQKMSANFYDRQIAFQSADAGLAAATEYISTNGAGIVNCAAGGQACTVDPFTDPNLPDGAIQVVAEGVGKGEFTAAANATGQPQFVVQYMGEYADQNAGTGFGQTANAAQYGAQGLSTTSRYYRVTVRSGDPAKVDKRAVVTLQAYYKQ